MDEIDQFIYERMRLQLWYDYAKGKALEIEPFDFTEKEYKRIRDEDADKLSPGERALQERANNIRQNVKGLIKNELLEKEDFGHEAEKFRLQNELYELYQQELLNIEKRLDSKEFEQYFDKLRFMKIDDLMNELQLRKSNGFRMLGNVNEVIDQLASALNTSDLMTPEERTLLDAEARKSGGMAHGSEAT